MAHCLSCPRLRAEDWRKDCGWCKPATHCVIDSDCLRSSDWSCVNGRTVGYDILYVMRDKVNCVCAPQRPTGELRFMCVHPSDRLANYAFVCVHPSDRLANYAFVSVYPSDRLANYAFVCVYPSDRLANYAFVCVYPSDRLANYASIHGCEWMADNGDMIIVIYDYRYWAGQSTAFSVCLSQYI